MASLTSRLTAFGVEHEQYSSTEARSAARIYTAEVMGVCVRLSAGFIYARSLCCGEPLEDWVEDELPEYTCGGCGDETGFPTALPDRLSWDALREGGLASWAAGQGEVSLDPLTLTLECSLACDELLAAWTEVAEAVNS